MEVASSTLTPGSLGWPSRRADSPPLPRRSRKLSSCLPSAYSKLDRPDHLRELHGHRDTLTLPSILLGAIHPLPPRSRAGLSIPPYPSGVLPLVPACSKRAAGLGKERPFVSIGVQMESRSEQGKHEKPQASRSAASPCQGEGRQFESGRPLRQNPLVTGGFFWRLMGQTCQVGPGSAASARRSRLPRRGTDLAAIRGPGHHRYVDAMSSRAWDPEVGMAALVSRGRVT